jgi:ElaB/YqjD/DUF883 family membrane-anchored ribosome-binding protein
MAQATEQVAGQAQELAGQAREQVQNAAGQARTRVQEQVDQRSTEAGQKVSSTAGDLRSVAESLRGEGKEQPAKLAEQAADRVERLGGYLEQSDADRMLRDVEDFARRRPWAVGMGAAAVGFAAARFLKATSADRYEGRQSQQLSGPAASSRRAGNGDGAENRPYWEQGVNVPTATEPVAPTPPSTIDPPRTSL